MVSIWLLITILSVIVLNLKAQNVFFHCMVDLCIFISLFDLVMLRACVSVSYFDCAVPKGSKRHFNFFTR